MRCDQRREDSGMGKTWRLRIAVLLSLGMFVLSALVLDATEESDPWVAVADVGRIDDGRPLFDEESGVFVIRARDGILALSGRGPFRSEVLLFCVSSRMFQGPSGDV